MTRFGYLAATLVARLEAEAAPPSPTRDGLVHRREAFDALADRVENVGHLTKIAETPNKSE